MPTSADGGGSPILLRPRPIAPKRSTSACGVRVAEPGDAPNAACNVRRCHAPPTGPTSITIARGVGSLYPVAASRVRACAREKEAGCSRRGGPDQAPSP